MKITAPSVVSAFVLACGAAGLTGCAEWWRKKPEMTQAADPEPEPPAPKPPEPEPPVKPQPEPEPPVADGGQIPTARPVPGRPGYVFSPFNNKLVDVKDFPSGRLVADPHYPISEKKYFRVP